MKTNRSAGGGRLMLTGVLAVAGAVASGRAHAQAPGTSTAPSPGDPGPVAGSPPEAPGVTNPPPFGGPTTVYPTTAPPPAPVPTMVPMVPMEEKPVPTPAVSNVGPTYAPWLGRMGAGLLVGGGVEDFTDASLKDMTSVGGSWDARAIAGTRQYIGVEAAYVGAARTINALGLSGNAGLVSNGLEGVLRVNAPLQADRSLIEPFGFIGLGWQHYKVVNTSVNTSDLASSDDVMTVPYGGGLELAYKMFMADARFTYRQTYQNDLLRTNGGRLNNWGLSAQVGVEF